MRLILPIWILLLHMTCAWGLLIPQETRMGAEGWAAYSSSSTSTSTQASRSATRTVQYSYDDLHRLTSEVLGGSEETGTVAYTLDDVGNRLGRTSSVSGITPQSLSYSANDWLNSHQYDANGNTLRSDLTSGSVARDAYDFKNRLSQRRIYDASGTVLQKIVDLRYDGDGSLKWKRVTDTTTGEETIRYFVVDHHNLTGYSQIVEELDATGGVVATYHYGHDLISQSKLVEDKVSGASEWVDRLFLYDGGGHVRALTDLEGNITDTFSYDAYGNLLGYSLSAIGDCPTFYLYRGERWDSDLGQYYLRARFYDANLGRFHTLDEYEGRTGEPLSLHKYLYAHANPVTGWDPSGRMTLAANMFTVVSIVAIGTAGILSGPGSMRRAGQSLIDAVISGIGEVSSGAVAAVSLAYMMMANQLDALKRATDALRKELKRIRCRGRLLFHYTNPGAARDIAFTGYILSSKGFGNGFPPGAYASDVWPTDLRFTKRTLAMAFKNYVYDVSAFVAFCSTRFIIAPGFGIIRSVPHYYAPTKGAKVPVPVDVMMWYRLLGQVGVKFVYEGGVGALPLSENGNKARRRKEAIAN